MVKICKFCQIRDEAQTKPNLLVYSDSQLMAFKDIRPQAKLHYLICPQIHIKNINTLERRREYLELLERMEVVARDLLMENSGLNTKYSD